MIRGRRGIAVAVAVILAAVLFSEPVHAGQLAMTATVPLSPVWKELIEKNSTFSLDTHTHRNIAELTGRIRGIETVTLPPQTVQALLFEGSTLVDSQLKTTDAAGNISFTFVYKRGAMYRIIVVGSPDESPFVIDIRQF